MTATAMTPCSVLGDDDVICSHPKDPYQSGQVQDVELLLGITGDEGYLFFRYFGATDFQAKTRETAEKLTRDSLLALGFPSITADKAVTMASPLYFDQCGDDVEKLTRATSEILGHIIIEPAVFWTAKQHSRECT